MDSYDLIDKFLRNNLDDEDYAHFSCALDAVYAGQQDDALAAANERIRELEKLADAISRDCNNTANERNNLRDQLATEREVSDKLEKALQSLIGPASVLVDYLDDGREVQSLYEDLRRARAALAEVAAIRDKGEQPMSNDASGSQG